MLAEDPVDACKIPVRVSGSGMVTSVEKERHSFVLFPTQNISASPNPECLPVRAVLEKGPKWPNPIARLPSPHGFVAFTGKLAHFEENLGQTRSDLRSRAVVALDSITYLRANYGSGNALTLPAMSHSQDADTVALKSHILKYSQLKSEPASSKSENTGRSCKRKTHGSFDSGQGQEEGDDDK